MHARAEGGQVQAVVGQRVRLWPTTPCLTQTQFDFEVPLTLKWDFDWVKVLAQ